MSIFVCPECSAQIDTDYRSEDVYCDGENDPICIDCHEEWFAKQAAYWKPLYDAEKRAGLLKRKEDLDAELREAGRGHLVASTYWSDFEEYKKAESK